MLKLTKAAARHIKRDASTGDMEELALRIAASRGEDGGIDDRMGFDEIKLSDVVVSSHGVDVVVAESDRALLEGTVLDYVELEPQRFEFIFMNPNDPHYRPPTD